MLRRFVFAAVVLTMSPVLSATVLVPASFRDLVVQSPVIVRGRVVDVRSAWADGRRRVESYVTLDAEEYLKGQLGSRIVFKVPGGELGRYRTIMVGAPVFRAGDEAVLFLASNGRAYPVVAGLSQGVFRIRTDRLTGRTLIRSPATMPMGRRGNRERDRPVLHEPIEVDAFSAAVRRVLATAGGER